MPEGFRQGEKATQARGKLHGYYGAAMLGKAGLEEQPLN